jgi:ferric-dicitrate binding protein FerR (iron transport regulator)
MPLVAGDTVVTGPGGRAEVRLDDANYVRLSQNAEVRLKQLGERTYSLEVLRGTVAYSMLKYGEADVDMQTPNANVVPRKDGLYRVAVLSPKESTVTVRKGEAEVLTPDGTVVVKKGKEALVSGAAERRVASAPNKDAFDEWNERRNEMLDRGRGPMYAGGPWYPGTHIGVGWGWPYYDPFWYPYGGFYPRTVIVTGHRGGGGGHRR